MVELACPESCQYLQSARRNSAEQIRELRAREFRMQGWLDPILSERGLAALMLIERTIIDMHRELRGDPGGQLTDSEVLTAVQTTIKNLETEDRGIIYEHRTTSPRVQELAKRIRQTLDEAPRILSTDELPRRSEIVVAANVVRVTIEALMHARDERLDRTRNYLRQVSLFYPMPAAESQRLII